MASLGGPPFGPGTTLGGTGSYRSVASGRVGSVSWALAQGPQRAKKAMNRVLKGPRSKFPDPDVPEGHLVPVVLYPQFSGLKGPEALPTGELGFGHHFLPRFPMDRKFHDFLAVEDHMPLVGPVIDHNFHLVPFPGRLDGVLG